jgi:hypothetical protein
MRVGFLHPEPGQVCVANLAEVWEHRAEDILAVSTFHG